jgi:putative nucleotidyltransferase with HDIG domain
VSAVAKVLLVGDDKERTGGVREILAQDGHQVAVVRDVARWREWERAESPEVVVAAVATPEPVLVVPLGGRRGLAPPILFVHRERDDAPEPYVEERLVDRLTSPYPAEELLGRVDALIRVRRVVFHHENASMVSSAADKSLGRWAAAMTALLGSRIPRPQKPSAAYLEVAARVADWADRRDGFEAGHAERVTNFAAMIADAFALPDAEAVPLLRAAMLHDIGKVALPVEVLRQKTPLADSQMRLLRTHPERGASILRALDKDEAVAETILYHHEYVDGSGYYGRRGEDVPRAARILAVAEAFDAMTTSLVRKPLTQDEAFSVMHERRGSQWDADSVDALVKALRPSARSVPLSTVGRFLA